ncbi:MAG: MucBP domain-containing protein [Streptococcaceae bacterium]|jgi:hypothetical protein|nr:MucBP domain-containing protein [Streptococcaceae bacterium]
MKRQTKIRLASSLILPAFLASPAVNILSPFGIVTLNAHADVASPQLSLGPEDFQNYFSMQGSASYSYTPGSWYGMLTITPNAKTQIGMATLNTKIDTTKDWNITGQLNVGNAGGADGVGFGWTQAAPGQTGQLGSSLGIGKLAQTFGWVANTYQNDSRSTDTYTIYSNQAIAGPNGTTNGNTYKLGGLQGYYSYGDPNYSSAASSWGQGGFAFSNPDNLVFDNKLTSYNLSNSPQQSIYSLMDGQFHVYSISYTAATGLITVSFGDLTWQLPMTTLMNATGITDPTKLAFFIAGSTGGLSNLQQFAFVSMNFTPASMAGTTTTYYVDTEGNTLAAPKMMAGNVGASYTTNPLASSQIPQGYKLLQVDSSDASVTRAANDTVTGTYTNTGTNITYIYGVPPVVTHVEETDKTLTRTIHYVDALDATIKLADDVVQAVTFKQYAMVDQNGNVLGYDTNGDGTVDTMDASQSWLAPNGNTWAEVDSPEVEGYNAPSQASVAAQVVAVSDENVDVTVTYTLDDTQLQMPDAGSKGYASVGLIAGLGVIGLGGAHIARGRRPKKKYLHVK